MNTAWSKPAKYIVGVSIALLGIFILYLSRSVIPLLILAGLIAVIVRPVIMWLHTRVGLPRGVAVAVVYLIVVILAPLAVALAVPAVLNAVRYVLSLDYQRIFQDVGAWLTSALISIKATQISIEPLDNYVDQAVDALLVALQNATPAGSPELPPPVTILQSVGSALTTTFGAAAELIGTVFSTAVLVIFIFLASIYISLSAHTYRDSFLRVVPPIYQPEIAILVDRIERTWNAFFRGQITLMLLIGSISWVGLTALGVPGALSLAIIAGLLELIPNLGPIIATIPAVIVALLQGSTLLPVSNLTMALVVLIFYIIVQQLENSVIVPRVLGEAVELPPLVVMTGVLVGGTVGGILGTLLATPIIATLREILKYVYRKIQGDDPYPSEETAPVRQPSKELRRSWREIWRKIRPPQQAPNEPVLETDSNPSPETGAEVFPPPPA